LQGQKTRNARSPLRGFRGVWDSRDAPWDPNQYCFISLVQLLRDPVDASTLYTLSNSLLHRKDLQIDAGLKLAASRRTAFRTTANHHVSLNRCLAPTGIFSCSGLSKSSLSCYGGAVRLRSETDALATTRMEISWRKQILCTRASLPNAFARSS
jgi:hypothetical protein